jgi:hypothetical protein
MKPINMPGFTAHASLYEASGNRAGGVGRGWHPTILVDGLELG